jgi:hypothetical protein
MRVSDLPFPASVCVCARVCEYLKTSVGATQRRPNTYIKLTATRQCADWLRAELYPAVIISTWSTAMIIHLSMVR